MSSRQDAQRAVTYIWVSGVFTLVWLIVGVFLVRAAILDSAGDAVSIKIAYWALSMVGWLSCGANYRKYIRQYGRDGGRGLFNAVALGAILTAGVYYFLIIRPTKAIIKERFDARAHELAIVVRETKATGRKSSAEFEAGILTGTLLPIDSETDRLDDSYFLLPFGIRPNEPSGIRYAALMTRGRSMFGVYSDGTPGYQLTCEVIVVDLQKHEIVAQTALFGSPPPMFKGKVTIGEVTGNAPDYTAFFRELTDGPDPHSHLTKVPRAREPVEVVPVELKTEDLPASATVGKHDK